MPGVKILVSGMPFDSSEDDYKNVLGTAGEISHVWPLDKQRGRQAVVKFKNVIEAVCGGIFTKKFRDKMGGEINCKMYLAQRKGKTVRPKYDVESTAILVSNLDPSSTKEAIEIHFRAFGSILTVLVDATEEINPEAICQAIVVFANGKDSQAAVNIPLIHEIDGMILDIQYLARSYYHLLPPEATQASRLRQASTTHYAGPNGEVRDVHINSEYLVTVIRLPELAAVDSIKNSLTTYGVIKQCTRNRDDTATVEFERAEDASFACEIGWCYLHNTCCELVQLGKRAVKKRDRERDRDRDRDRERDWDRNKENRERDRSPSKYQRPD